jgi:hypothetical protein
MLVSSPVVGSKSLSFRFAPAVDWVLGDLCARNRLAFVRFKGTAGDCERSAIVEPSRREGWRMVALLVASPEAGRCWAGII